MKKFLSLLLVAVMVFGVIGLVGCKGGQNETTTTTTTQGAQTTTTTTKVISMTTSGCSSSVCHQDGESDSAGLMTISSCPCR